MLEVRDGPLAIDPQLDGPLQVRGNLEITSGTGRVVARVSTARLCRCGGSNNKPFCDGTHARSRLPLGSLRSAEFLPRSRRETPRNARELLAADDLVDAEPRLQAPAHRGHERAAAGRERAVDVAAADARAREHVVEHALDRDEVLLDPAVERLLASPAGRA